MSAKPPGQRPPDRLEQAERAMSDRLEDDPSARVAIIQVGTQEYAVLSFASVPASQTVLLSAAEREIVALVLEAKSNAEIARVRGTSPRTVANQLAGIYRKLGIQSRAELAVICAQRRRTDP